MSFVPEKARKTGYDIRGQKKDITEGLTHSGTLLEEKRRRPPQYRANAQMGIHPSCPRLWAVEGRASLETPNTVWPEFRAIRERTWSRPV
jgi:hypothetical protein